MNPRESRPPGGFLFRSRESHPRELTAPQLFFDCLISQASAPYSECMPIQICPRCKGTCKAIEHERVQIDECQSCQGVWLDPGELKLITEREEARPSPQLTQETLAAAHAGVSKAEAETVLPCPVCRSPMRAVNFNYASGVIINTCQTHGAWLDHHELERIEGTLEHWNRQKAAHGTEWQKAAQSAGIEGSEKIHAIESEVKNKLGASSLLFKIFPFLNR